MAEPKRVETEEPVEPKMSQQELDDLLESMVGMWTGWFDEYGGVDAYWAKERGETTEEAAGTSS